MSRKIEDLAVEMQPKCIKVVNFCANFGVDILVYCTTRGAEEQARTFRKSRTRLEISHKADELRLRGFSFLADILESVGPQHGELGKHVTFAGPGESWHQYGYAFDAVPIVDSKCLWDYGSNKYEWALYGEAISEAGLFWGASFKDFPHCQYFERGNPLDVLTSEEVERMLIR